MSGETTIYIRVTTRGGPSWRPVAAARLGDDVYRILGKKSVVAGEEWPFEPGDVVRCKPYELTDNDLVLVAYEKITPVA